MKLTSDQIEQAIAHLNPAKIAEHMERTGHAWVFPGERQRPPRAAEIKAEARRLLGTLSWNPGAASVTNIGTGGLYAHIVFDSYGEPCGARISFEIADGATWWRTGGAQ